MLGLRPLVFKIVGFNELFFGLIRNERIGYFVSRFIALADKRKRCENLCIAIEQTHIHGFNTIQQEHSQNHPSSNSYT